MKATVKDEAKVKARGKAKARKRLKRRRARIIDIDNLPPTLTLPELAELMNCTRQHVWAEVKRGNIKTTVPLGRVQRVPRPEVQRLYNGERPAAD